MLRPLHKVGLGCFVLAVTFGLWWYTGHGAGASPTVQLADVSWNALPLVMKDEQVQRPTDTAIADGIEHAVFFVYRPHDCYRNRAAMDGWHRVAASLEQVEAVNVLKERGATPARRYLSEFATPYPTRLDTTEWFNHTLGVDSTPAVVLVSEDEKPRIISPSEQRSDNDRRRLLDVS